ncbi:MAG TPA: hypothetical protein VGT41_01020 [Candidatus Babeliales bacterium]|nr:hypothetical protein [Candidatus Babeliales bacterium]
MIRNVKSCILITILLIVSSKPVIAGHQFEDPLFGNETIENDLINNFLDSTEFDITRDPTPQDTASLLVELGAVAILQEDFFLHTNPLVTRPVTTLSPFYNARIPAYCKTANFNFFYNQTSRMNFTKESTAISSYLAIQSQSLLDKINSSTITDLIKKLKFDLFPVDLLALFKNTAINERRAGCMFQYDRRWDRMRFRSMTPLYYLERNFFLTENERENIERTLGKTSEEDAFNFAKQHLICDKVGIGDTRIMIDVDLYSCTVFDSKIGFCLTLPTAFSMGSGLIGSSFKKSQKRPVLNITNLLALLEGTTAQQEQAKELATAFGLGIIDSLSANLLNAELGNNKHLGVGVYYESATALENFIKMPWARHFSLKSYGMLEYQIPKTERRYFVAFDESQLYNNLRLNRSKEDISNDIDNDPIYAQQVLTFLEQQIVDKFYPFPFDVQVHPIIMVHTVSKLQYDAPNWGFFLGFDFWLASKEQLKNVGIVRTDNNRPPNIDIGKAIKPRAYESKIIAGASWSIKRDNLDWLLSLNGDSSYWGSGIGNNFTLSFNVAVNF